MHETADEMMEYVQSSGEAGETTALKITDRMGTTVWLAPAPEPQIWDLHIRHPTDDPDSRDAQPEADVRDLLSESIREELDGEGTAVNYVDREDTPL